jgi:hypothetical protein
MHHYISTPKERNVLIEECLYFHSLLFNDIPSGTIMDFYISAHRELSDLRYANGHEAAVIKTIVQKRLCAPGIEPWLRAGKQRHILTRKLMLLSYLAECSGSSPIRKVFFGRPTALPRMFLLCCRALGRLTTGYIQRLIYGLV